MTQPHPPPNRFAATAWSPFVGHALTVVALALGGLSSFHALRAEVVELRSNLHALMSLEAEHTRRAEAGRDEADRRHGAEWQQLRDELREVRAEVRELKHMFMKGRDTP
jgi:hypothetical protein